MAASSAESATGTTFTWNSVVVAEVNTVGDISLTSDDIEVTHYTSDDGYKEYIQGLRDGGEITVTGNLLSGDAGQASFIADINTGVKRTGIVTLPNTDASLWTFTAYVKGFMHTFPIGDKLGFEATIKISGKPTFTV